MLHMDTFPSLENPEETKIDTAADRESDDLVAGAVKHKIQPSQ